ncbi:MAG: 3TM-type holin [Rhodovibrionaceae bacterium]
MLPAILAQLGLPLLVRAAAWGLGKLDSPAAEAASQALEEVETALGNGAIPAEQVAEANRHIEAMSRIASTRESGILAEINATMRTEARSEDAYVRRWRPTFGYAVALTWTVQMGGLTYAVIVTPEYAGEIFTALGSLSLIWGVALSVLGINAVKRSQDKAVLAGQPLPGSLGGRIAGAIFGPRDEA